MEFKKCARCGCFYTSNDNVCYNCLSKERFEMNKFKNYIEEANLESINSLNDIAINTGISGKGVQCVMKLDRARINPASPWIFCVKCPDTDGKYMGDINEVEVCLKSTGRRDLWEKHFEDKK